MGASARSRRTATRDDGQADGKNGNGKGKSKDQAGNQLCFSWGSGTGPCADVPAGAECKCKVKRAHKCQICLSPAHRTSECPNC